MFVILSWIILVLVAGLRYETGGDWSIYGHIFEKINPIKEVLSGSGFGFNREMGFVFLCSLIKQFGGTLQTVFFLVTLLNLSLITYSLKIYTKYIIVGLLVYYCMLYFSLEMIFIRQSTAVAFCFFAMKYVKQNNFWKYLLFVFIASLFHRTSLLMIPLYWIFKYRMNNIVITIVILLGGVVMFFNIPWLKGVLLLVSNFLGPEFGNRAIYYTSESRFSVSREISVGFLLNLFILAAVLWRRPQIEKTEHGNTFINMYVVSLMIYYYGYEFFEINSRFRLSYLISVIVLFPLLLESFKFMILRIFSFVSLVVYCFIFSQAIFLERPPAIPYNPYQNYLIYKWFNKKSTGLERAKEGDKQFSKQREEMRKRQEK